MQSEAFALAAQPRHGQLEEMLRLTEEREQQIQQWHGECDREADAQQGRATQLVNSLHIHRTLREDAEAQAAERLRRLRMELSARCAQASEERRADEARLRQQVDDRVAELRRSVAETLEARNGARQHEKGYSEQIADLYQSLEQARSGREEKCQKIGEVMRGKLTEIGDVIVAERRFRLDTQSTLLQLFGEMGEKLERQLETAKKERHASTDRLISLVETLLPRLEASRRNETAQCLQELRGSGRAQEIAMAMSTNAKLAQRDRWL